MNLEKTKRVPNQHINLVISELTNNENISVEFSVAYFKYFNLDDKLTYC